MACKPCVIREQAFSCGESNYVHDVCQAHNVASMDLWGVQGCGWVSSCSHLGLRLPPQSNLPELDPPRPAVGAVLGASGVEELDLAAAGAGGASLRIISVRQCHRGLRILLLFQGLNAKRILKLVEPSLYPFFLYQSPIFYIFSQRCLYLHPIHSPLLVYISHVTGRTPRKKSRGIGVEEALHRLPLGALQRAAGARVEQEPALKSQQPCSNTTTGSEVFWSATLPAVLLQRHRKKVFRRFHDPPQVASGWPIGRRRFHSCSPGQSY